ncbi:NAD(P)H-dependent oxidoreductase [Vibrio sp. Vb2110]|uniref:FMN-dependent NADH-azoreductase n=1 Tax=Vibrio TaxID=662 RepID=UPI00080F4A2B|nr:MULTISPECIES: NAD(P)H-dependent oxidoreductase [Vibrio]EHR5764744.1 NAD(P)H-dependent oxidoreductase [Vibrio parahaemolyticus]EHY0932579.1 NAD(P)H-dependent oxidoreductase [Vibrio parahaemolyticus]EIZ0312369.1 NAD(P)H-dependent oxidoreductase [Vibrio parahaemolyticus]ELA9196556.1 NAD(P)H-dependent oxidoreductase [Vibrio parahaemolyticus]ELU8564354.1 NAD(P)H-dependent oxidoreductase [Vibrio parahaemolyticus]
MRILLVNGSPKQRESSTYDLANIIINYVAQEAENDIVEQNVMDLPHVDSDYSEALCTPELMRCESKGSLALSNKLIADLVWSDLVIITSPIHNFSLPSGLKCWIDHVVRAGKTFYISPTGKHALLENKPVYILTSSGGRFSGENSYQPDYFIPYIKDVLGVIGLENLHFFSLEGTASKNVNKELEVTSERLRNHLIGSKLSFSSR